MFKFRFLFPVVLIFAGWLSFPAFTQEKPADLLLFYSDTCPHCHNVRTFLTGQKEKNPTLIIEEYDVFDSTDRETYLKLSSAYSQNINTIPVVIINDQVFIGDGQATLNSIEQEINHCLATQDCPAPLEKINQVNINSPTDMQKQKLVYLFIGLGVIIAFILAFFLYKGKKHARTNN